MDNLSRDAPTVSEADIEDAMAHQEAPVEEQQFEMDDDPMLDDFAEDELEARVASYEQGGQTSTPQRPPSLCLSDEEYDDLFAELAAQDSMQISQQPSSSDQMDGLERS